MQNSHCISLYIQYSWFQEMPPQIMCQKMVFFQNVMSTNKFLVPITCVLRTERLFRSPRDYLETRFILDLFSRERQVFNFFFVQSTWSSLLLDQSRKPATLKYPQCSLHEDINFIQAPHYSFSKFTHFVRHNGEGWKMRQSKRNLRDRNILKPEDKARAFCIENKDPADGLLKVKINDRIGRKNLVLKKCL